MTIHIDSPFDKPACRQAGSRVTICFEFTICARKFSEHSLANSLVNLFLFLAFYSLQEGVGENLGFLVGLIIPYWLLKCAMSVIETPFTYMGVRWLREGDKS